MRKTLLIFAAAIFTAAFCQAQTPPGYKLAAPHGNTLPTTCEVVGQFYHKDDAPAGQNWYTATAIGPPCVWTLQTGVLSDDGSTVSLPAGRNLAMESVASEMKHCPVCDVDVPGSLREHIKTAQHKRSEDEMGAFGLPNASMFSREQQTPGRHFGESARKPSLDEYDRR